MEFTVLFTVVVFGNFNNKNVIKHIQKRFVTLIFKKNPSGLLEALEVHVRVTNNAIAGRNMALLETGVFRNEGCGPLLRPLLEPGCTGPLLVAPNCGNLHGPHNAFTAACFR